MYLSTRKVLLKDFGAHTQQVRTELKGISYAHYKELGLPISYWYPRNCRTQHRI